MRYRVQSAFQSFHVVDDWNGACPVDTFIKRKDADYHCQSLNQKCDFQNLVSA